ncbi:DUF421 domain-containing protein [Paenibacillus oryzisoli]|uniref:DUF421 domain-containing protein n=1 Tax=Paenibacillus oryzisoli TaxID=1850517 RepID=A0A198A4K6_9BACL|nr:DUF421 domain-containing protein [Paenibacillus oryzisoli]OAS15893.1 hypothetical protein A8708_09375 [Paenibacillus oryzisoli]
MFEHYIILIRSISAFLILLCITRLLGKQTLSNMNFLEFITAVILGAIGANFAFNEKIQVIHLMISLSVFTLTSYFLSKLLLRFRKLRMWTEGTPSVLIEGGKILEGNLKKNNLTLDTLNQLLRQKDIFDINEVDYAILEINGKLSVNKKKEYQNTTLKDLKLTGSSTQQFPLELIMDGCILYGNLDANQISHSWLLKELEFRNKKAEDVFYSVRGSNGQLYFDYRDDGIQHPIDVE